MSYLGDALDRLLDTVECLHCGWAVKAGSGSQAADAMLIIHHCPEDVSA